MTTTDAIAARGLCRRYGRRWALVDVSFRVAPGTSVMLAGRNGSGKSTLLRILATAIRPDRGAASVLGLDLVADREAIRRQVALMSHASYLFEGLTAVENLRIAARFLARPASRAALLPLLEQVELVERADDPVGTFSAGMRKRLALARTLLQEGRLVLLDEPYGELDPPGFRLVDHLFGIFKARGATVVMATHLLDRGAALCDVGIVLEAGRLRWQGAARDLPALGGLDPASSPEGAA